MCRNITTLRGLEPAATPTEIEAAARQYVRKVTGVQKTAPATEEAFERAVALIAEATADVIAVLLLLNVFPDIAAAPPYQVRWRVARQRTPPPCPRRRPLRHHLTRPSGFGAARSDVSVASRSTKPLTWLTDQALASAQRSTTHTSATKRTGRAPASGARRPSERRLEQEHRAPTVVGLRSSRSVHEQLVVEAQDDARAQRIALACTVSGPHLEQLRRGALHHRVAAVAAAGRGDAAQVAFAVLVRVERAERDPPAAVGAQLAARPAAASIGVVAGTSSPRGTRLEPWQHLRAVAGGLAVHRAEHRHLRRSPARRRAGGPPAGRGRPPRPRRRARRSPDTAAEHPRFDLPEVGVHEHPAVVGD
ncbi:MAG: DUF2277 domain-containing protein, partial [Microthrixaceae bacterium]